MSLPASAVLNGDYRDGVIDESLSGMQQKGPTSVDPDCGGMAVDMVDNRTRGGSPSSSSRSTTGNSQGKHTTFLNFYDCFFGQHLLLIRSQVQLQ